MVVYTAFDSGHEGIVNVREVYGAAFAGDGSPPIDGWLDDVTWPDGQVRTRFVLEHPQTWGGWR